MEQPDPIAVKTRQLAEAQMGNLILALCEANAKADVLAADLAAVTKERDALKAKADAAILTTVGG